MSILFKREPYTEACSLSILLKILERIKSSWHIKLYATHTQTRHMCMYLCVCVYRSFFTIFYDILLSLDQRFPLALVITKLVYLQGLKSAKWSLILYIKVIKNGWSQDWSGILWTSKKTELLMHKSSGHLPMIAFTYLNKIDFTETSWQTL